MMTLIIILIIIITTMVDWVDFDQQILNIELFQACEQNDLSGAQEAVYNSADLEQKRSYGDTPLLSACVGGDPSRAVLVEWILQQADGRATVNTVNKYGNTPLHIAASWSNRAAIRL